MNNEPMTPLQAIVYWTVYILSTLFYHLPLFVWRWSVFIVLSIADVVVKAVHWVVRRGRK